MSDVMRSEDEPYARAWRKYRNWSRAFWPVFFSFLPGVALIDRFVWRVRGDAANNVTVTVALLWMLAFGIAGYFKGNFSCPRCGESFFSTWDDRPWRQGVRSNMLARRCMHCGLPKWAARDPGPATTT